MYGASGATRWCRKGTDSRGGTLGWAIDLELCALSWELGGLSETVSVKLEQPRGACMLGPHAHQPSAWDAVLSQGPWSLRCLCGGVGEGVRASSCRTRCAAWVSSSLPPTPTPLQAPPGASPCALRHLSSFRAPPSPSWVTGLNLSFGPCVYAAASCECQPLLSPWETVCACARVCVCFLVICTSTRQDVVTFVVTGSSSPPGAPCKLRGSQPPPHPSPAQPALSFRFSP